MKYLKGIWNMKGKGTKETILSEALRLYAHKGYLATSMSDIAMQINISKQAIYKHYHGKKDILDSIVNTMEQRSAQMVKKYQMPEGDLEQVAKMYKKIPVEKIKEYTKAQFEYWTEDEFACNFRKMITLEQYRDSEMAELFKRYLICGPIEYMTQLFGRMLGTEEEARQFAYDFYGPIYILYSVFDHVEDREMVIKRLEEHVEHFSTYFEAAQEEIQE